MNQIHIGVPDFNVLRKCTPMGKPRLAVSVANLRVTRRTFDARPTSTAEWHGYSITHAPVPHLLSNCCYFSGQLMTWHMG
jgi:hypothetical protein